MPARLCASIWPMTRCSRHNGTKIAMGRSGTQSSSASAGRGRLRQVQTSTSAIHKSSSPLSSIQRASGTRHAATQWLNPTNHNSGKSDAKLSKIRGVRQRDLGVDHLEAQPFVIALRGGTRQGAGGCQIAAAGHGFVEPRGNQLVVQPAPPEGRNGAVGEQRRQPIVYRDRKSVV